MAVMRDTIYHRDICITDCGDTTVITTYHKQLPRGNHVSRYSTMTAVAAWLEAPVIVYSTNKADALRAHESAVRAVFYGDGLE